MKPWAAIIGFGNIILTDDGVGPAAIAYLNTLGMPEGVELVDGGTSALDAVPYLEERSLVLLVDAVSGGGPPGAVYRFTLDDLEADGQPALSLHAFRLIDAARLWELQLGRLPRVVIFGVEPKTVTAGFDLSPEVRGVLSKLRWLILEELQAFEASGESNQ